MENQRWNPAYLARYISTNLIPSTGLVVIPAAFLSVVIRYPGWREKKTLCPRSPAHKCSHTNCKAGTATGPSTGEPLNGVWDARKGMQLGNTEPAGTRLSEANQTRDGRVCEYRKCPGEASLRRQKPHQWLLEAWEAEMGTVSSTRGLTGGDGNGPI